jgi:Kdo2-lipid IVA lauroyltransferase/acyltransferase
VTVSFRHRLEYGAVVAVSAIVRRLPRRVAVGTGSLLGLAFYALDGPHRRLAKSNLEAAFPRRSPRERDAIARRVFVHFGRVLVEMLRYSGLTPDEILGECEFVGQERVPQIQAMGKGALFVTGHFGFWELHALAHGHLFGRISVVARALDNPLLHDMLERVRTATGNQVIYRRGGVRRILRALQQNHGVAVLIDQHIQAVDAVVVDFFDRPASTTSAVAALALRTGAPIIPVFTLPLDNGKYRMIYEPPIEPPEGTGPEALRELTQRCTDVLEMYVRRYPHLWLWMHRRWRDVEQPDAGGMFPTANADAAADAEVPGGAIPEPDRPGGRSE